MERAREDSLTISYQLTNPSSICTRNVPTRVRICTRTPQSCPDEYHEKGLLGTKITTQTVQMGYLVNLGTERARRLLGAHS